MPFAAAGHLEPAAVAVRPLEDGLHAPRVGRVLARRVVPRVVAAAVGVAGRAQTRVVAEPDTDGPRRDGLVLLVLLLAFVLRDEVAGDPDVDVVSVVALDVRMLVHWIGEIISIRGRLMSSWRDSYSRSD